MTNPPRPARHTPDAGQSPTEQPQSTPDRPAVNPSTAGHPLTGTGWHRPRNENYATYARRGQYPHGAHKAGRRRDAGRRLTEREAALLLAHGLREAERQRRAQA